MINTKKVLLITFLILIPLASILSSVYLLSVKKEEDVKGVKTEIERCVPYISNSMPRVAYIGQEYSFYPRITDCGSDEILLDVSGVEWLSVNNNMGISGTPTMADVGTFKIEIYTRNRSDSYTLTDYIIVKADEE